MRPIRILSDSSCDLPEDEIQAQQIQVIPFYISFDKVHYQKEGVELSRDDFFKQFTGGVFPKTSVPTIEDYSRAFSDSIEAGYDVICICITDAFSGSAQSAFNAATMTCEKYPGTRVEVLNSRLATGAQGLLVLEACRMRDAGLSVDSIMDKLAILKDTARIQFTLDTLEYLQKGGRIGKVSAIAGSVLNIQPLIVLKDGELIPFGKARGRKKAMQKILEMFQDDVPSEDYDSYRFGVEVGTCHEDGAIILDQLESLLGRPVDVPCLPTGVTIGTYTGPSALGICYIRKFETI